MGLILDSTVLVAAEREGKNARKLLKDISGNTGDTEVAISVLTLVELAHGAARANTAERKEKRLQFIEELITALPVHPNYSRYRPSRGPSRRPMPRSGRPNPADGSPHWRYSTRIGLWPSHGKQPPLPPHSRPFHFLLVKGRIPTWGSHESKRPAPVFRSGPQIRIS